ncbi:hypothetical protein JKP88DRAFT_320814 [Tribonema minus]|uniref:Disease resistance R13L4/SHOC-2-like LRR domain-containing protein n=1 Tax=Tribonema minus TaxID=303371 RepID=A0A835Z3T8_9STRA|nr:hypothetical protein JKP88DRAFT_320814 [Tribonema minus]
MVYPKTQTPCALDTDMRTVGMMASVVARANTNSVRVEGPPWPEFATCAAGALLWLRRVYSPLARPLQPDRGGRRGAITRNPGRKAVAPPEGAEVPAGKSLHTWVGQIDAGGRGCISEADRTCQDDEDFQKQFGTSGSDGSNQQLVDEEHSDVDLIFDWLFFVTKVQEEFKTASLFFAILDIIDMSASGVIGGRQLIIDLIRVKARASAEGKRLTALADMAPSLKGRFDAEVGIDRADELLAFVLVASKDDRERMGVDKSLESLPESFGNLTALTSLDMQFCKSLVSLPESFGNLTALKTLSLAGCDELVRKPETFEFSNLTALTSLDLSYCTVLSSLPPSFGSLTALTSLDLSTCRALSSLPASFGNLTALTSLKLGGCTMLSSLPPSFGNLTALTSLDLEGCKRLTTLPESFGNLTALTSLDLGYCSSLSSLPPSFGNLTAVERCVVL